MSQNSKIDIFIIWLSDFARCDWSISGPKCTVHTYTNSDTIDYDFVDLENLNNIFINFVVNRT